jgi:hypothetical protein
MKLSLKYLRANDVSYNICKRDISLGYYNIIEEFHEDRMHDALLAIIGHIFAVGPASARLLNKLIWKLHAPSPSALPDLYSSW